MEEPIEAQAVEKPDKDAGEKPRPTFVPPIILRNKGVPITLYRLENGQVPQAPEDLGEEEEWNPPTRTFYLRFNANHVADIEEAFDGLQADEAIIDRQVKLMDGKALEGPAGAVYEEKVVGHETRTFYGMEAFQKAMEVKMNATVRKVLAIALGTSLEEAGNAMIPDQAMDYQAAVGVAWSIAQGVDPTDAAKVLQGARDAMAAGRARLASQLESTLVKAEA